MLAEKQQRLLDDLLAIPDPQERLAAIVARANRSPARALAPADRTDANRVPGCVSAVWLTATIAPAAAGSAEFPLGGRREAPPQSAKRNLGAPRIAADDAPSTPRLRLRSDADSPLVKGLVALLCEIYDDTPAAEAATFQAGLLEKLHITQNLSPTRRHGLAAVQARIRWNAEFGLRNAE